MTEEKPTIVCVEKFDSNKLCYIIDNIDTLFADIDDDTRKSLRTHLTNYFMNSNNGKIIVKYHQNKIFEQYQGRFFANGGLSLQSLKRCVRHTICLDMVDIDMCKCSFSNVLLNTLYSRINM
jgi:hypothetical protein